MKRNLILTLTAVIMCSHLVSSSHRGVVFGLKDSFNTIDIYLDLYDESGSKIINSLLPLLYNCKDMFSKRMVRFEIHFLPKLPNTLGFYLSMMTEGYIKALQAEGGQEYDSIDKFGKSIYGMLLYLNIAGQAYTSLKGSNKLNDLYNFFQNNGYGKEQLDTIFNNKEIHDELINHMNDFKDKNSPSGFLNNSEISKIYKMRPGDWLVYLSKVTHLKNLGCDF